MGRVTCCVLEGERGVGGLGLVIMWFGWGYGRVSFRFLVVREASVKAGK